MIEVNFELAKHAYGKVLKYPYGGELAPYEYMSLRVFRWDLGRAGMPIDRAFDLRLIAAGYRTIATKPARAHRPLPPCVLEKMSESWKRDHGYCKT
ncbi:hypothetical protein BIT28_07880 [Photobacterium proteolyticum]|uniref:Uncharacterized protein n=2 Tax=Photobacterium TaxID=657 RepID=A0A1Q9H0W6_9GAMM|nr:MULTISPECIES: hypothetical protein [Photobacterium]NBI54530.1 hypothetical protein [Photobacterium alginatilyticum]OLQ81135.1 hypothetical protein BIT28_07880 [Photobacterium proteolyticum]